MSRSFASLFVWFVMQLAASSAPAQTYLCSRPGKPDIPMGSSADQREMETGRDEVDDYLDQMREYLDCLSREHDDATSEARLILGNWEIEIDIYNAR
jgi:hypothetical protein